MLQKYKRQAGLLPFLQFFFVLLSGYAAQAQIYKHDFGAATINTHPYTGAPAILAPNLSGSSWTNSIGTWSSNSGSAGQAIQYFNTAGTTTVTLTFNVAPNFQVGITSFDFWRQRSNSGPQAWQISINGIDVGSGTTPLAGNGTGAAIGVTPVLNPVAGLTGTVTVVLTLSGASGAGNIRFDDFTLNGSVTSTCTTAVVTSYLPHSGPKDTMLIITGSGLTDTASVTIDGINMAFEVISDTEVHAMVPAGVTDGDIVLTATDGCFGQGDVPFTLLASDCESYGTEIYISQLYDQTPGSYGLIELYNPTNTTVNLSGYRLERAGNWGGPFAGPFSYTLNLSGSIPPLSTYLIESNNGTGGNCGITPNAYMGSGINDNDAIFLYKNNAPLDAARAPANTGYNVIRNPNAVAPNQVHSFADWTTTGQSCSNLGAHTGLPSTPPPPLISQPIPRTVCVNATTTFTGTFIPGTGYTYQWKMLTSTGTWVNVVNNATYSGATTTTLTINGVSVAMNNSQYYLQATSSPTCFYITEAAQLFVMDKPDAPTMGVVTQPTCTTPTGSVEITAPLDPDFVYSKDGVNYQPETIFDNLTPGVTYNFTVKNIAGCVSNITVQAINLVPGAPPAPTVTATQPDCDTATGSITVTAPVGAAYTYSIDGQPYVANPVFDPVAPGPHNITVKLAGCISPATSQTIDPAPITPTVPVMTAIQPTCTTPGSITVTSPLGAGYSYSIDGEPFQAGTTFTPVAPGPHNIVAKLGDCTSTPGLKTIDPVPGAPAAPTLAEVQPDCDTPTGSITVTAPVGAGYTYSIDGQPYVSTPTFDPVAPGPHNITVQFNGCTSAPSSKTINAQPVTPAAPTLTEIQPDCDTPTGSITVTAPLGAGYSYSIDGVLPYQTSPVFPVVATGPHTITVQLNGCISAPTSKTINAQPSTPAAPTLAEVHPDCDTPTGSITVTTPVGAGYSYSIDGDPYQTSPVFPVVATGPHNITVKLGDCVSAPASKTINAQPVTPAAPTLAEVHPDCDTPTGSITVTAPVGAGYTYSIDGTLPYQTSPIFPVVATGPHTITVQQNGCISSPASKTINAQPPTPAAPTLTEVHPDCDTPTGSITVTAPLGAGYSYSIDGTLPYQTSPVFPVVNPGPHNITVKLGDCISAPGSKTINAQPITPAAPTLAEVHPDCDTPTGSITVTAPVGAGYSYSIDGLLPYQTSPVFPVVASGPHTITVQLNGCISAPASKTINAQPVTPAAPTLAEVHPDCGTPTGSITVTAPVGAGYSYSIDGLPYQTSPVFPVVATGPHNVTVKLVDCISAPSSKTINAQPVTPAAPTLAEVHPDCDTPTGSITVTAPIGAGYTYSIDGQPYQAGTAFTVTPGPHNVTVKLGDCISAPASKTIDPQPATPPAPTFAAAVHPTCGVPTGSITVTSPLGADYSYSIDGHPYVTETTFNSVAPGSHTITVKTAAGCVSAPASQTINPALPVPVAPMLTATHPGCTETTGTITVTSPVGAGLTYSIDGLPYQPGTTFFNVLPGPHAIRVKNAEGCESAPKTGTVNPIPTAPDVPVLAAFHPGCNATKGSITVTSPLGNGYTYSIDGGPYVTGNTFTNLDPGSHTVIVKNTAGCLSNPATQAINTPPAIPGAPVVTITQPGCGIETGSIIVTSPLGGGLMYSVNSLGYQAEVLFDDLAPGNYVITARNTAGCVSAYTHFVINHPPLVPAEPLVTVTHPGCGESRGTITVNSPVGFGLEYSNNGVNFQPSRIFNSVAPGTYTITVRNSAGCYATLAGVTVDPAPAPAPDPGVITGDSAVCEGGTIQLANVATTGVWDTSNAAVATVDANGLVTTLAPGSVTITYTTGTVCTAEASKTITVHNLPQPTLRDKFLCVDNETGDVIPGVLVSGISGAGYTFEWSKGGTALPDTTSSIIINEAGEYTLTVTNTVTGCETTTTVTVGLSSLALAYADATIDFHYNQLITVHVTGGSGVYEYSLDGGPYQDEPYFSDIYEGEYHVTVRDKNGCGVLELEVYALNYPRFFSPNGDGARDTWNIDGLEDQPQAKIYIFDRYGKVIAGLKPGGPGWDGTYNGARLPATDYWFTLEYNSESGAPKEFKAHFSLLR
jgi:gliding motility-associated-like protein